MVPRNIWSHACGPGRTLQLSVASPTAHRRWEAAGGNLSSEAVDPKPKKPFWSSSKRGFGVLGLGSWALGLGFRVLGLGFRV